MFRGNTFSFQLFSVCSILFLALCAISLYLQTPILISSALIVILSVLLVQRPEFLMYALLAAIPWSIEYRVTESLSTDLPDEPLMVLLSFSVLAILVYNLKKFGNISTLSPIILILFLQFIWILIAVIFSTNILVSIKYLLAKSWYLLAFVGGGLILFRERRIIINSAIVLIASMLLVVLVALIRHSVSGFAFSEINDSVQPFFRNHVNYSALLICILPVLYFITKNAQNPFKYLFLFIFLIALVALYFSYSRGAWIAVFIGAATIFLIKKRLIVTAFVTAVFITILSFLWLQNNDRYVSFSHDYKTTIFHPDFREHLIATYKLKDVSTAERFYRWIAGIRMVKDYWQTGSGPSTFYPEYKSYTVPAFKTWVSRNEDRSTVHNYYLLVLVEQGVIGLLLMMFLLGYAFYTAQKIYHTTKDQFFKAVSLCTASILAMICTVNFLSDLIETDKIGSIFYLCLALLIVAEVKSKTHSILPAKPNS